MPNSYCISVDPNGRQRAVRSVTRVLFRSRRWLCMRTARAPTPSLRDSLREDGCSESRPSIRALSWWGVVGLNQRPLACRLSAAKRCAHLRERSTSGSVMRTVLRSVCSSWRHICEWKRTRTPQLFRSFRHHMERASLGNGCQDRVSEARLLSQPIPRSFPRSPGPGDQRGDDRREERGKNKEAGL
jgi:hypothetical protein